MESRLDKYVCYCFDSIAIAIVYDNEIEKARENSNQH